MEIHFVIENENDENVGLRQHLNLSDNAWLVIDSDNRSFTEESDPKLSTFLNRIFTNYYLRSEASIQERLIQKKHELDKTYSSQEFKNIDKSIKDLFTKQALDIYENELIKKNNSYIKGEGRKIRINKENVKILEDSPDAKYYKGVIGLYLKSIFEEYVTLPNYIREQIFFWDIYQTINDAIARGKKVSIKSIPRTTVKGDSKVATKFLVTPYKVLQDPTKTFNYLVGFSEKEDLITGEYLEKTIACHRLSRIDKINVRESLNGFISKEKKKEIEKTIRDKGVQFLTGEIKNIVIKFTPKGVNTFNRMLYMRPNRYEVDWDDNLLYTFHCTEFQALNYFFKFGWDANVISPESLRQQFITRYRSALSTYEGKTKDDVYKELHPETDSKKN